MYHLYFGDGRGTPGTLLTFFPIPGIGARRLGPGSVVRIDLVARPATVGWWARNLEREVDADGVLEIEDPDGLTLRIVPVENAPIAAGWAGLPVPPEHALGPIQRVRIETSAFAETKATLTLLGFDAVGGDPQTSIFGVHGGGSVREVELVAGSGPRAVEGAGSVHHVAFRVRDDSALEGWRARLTAEGYRVTEVKDRDYFRSIYFREPGGTLFELATDGPGFGADERWEALGESLKLPPFAEPHRKEIEAGLPPLRTVA